MRLDTLNDLLANELTDLYNAELRLIDALPAIIGAVSSVDLKHALGAHLEDTKLCAERLEKVFDRLGIEPGIQESPAAGIIECAHAATQAEGDADLKDAALIACIQKLKHYEIAACGTARTYARILDLADAAQILQLTLNEEKDTDYQLTELAERSINIKAASM